MSPLKARHLRAGRSLLRECQRGTDHEAAGAFLSVTGVGLGALVAAATLMEACGAGRA